MTQKKPLGRIPAERIRRTELPALAAGVVERFERLADLTGTISDVCDTLGLRCVIPAAVLGPIAPGKRIVGPALTMRNVERTVDIYKAVADNSNTMGETEAHNLAKPGDVLVIEGVTGCSNMGGLSATTGRRQGEIGAVIDGSIRDPDAYARLGWPVWCRGFTPITGKWRLETIEINGTVQVAGIQCSPGDLVCADAAGIAIIPHARVEEVLGLSEKFDKGDARRQADIEAGVSMHDMAGKSYK